MLSTGTPDHRRRSNRRWFFIACAVWVVAAALAALYFANVLDGEASSTASSAGPLSSSTVSASASGTSAGPSDGPAGASTTTSSTVLETTTVTLPSTTTTASTTTTTPPALTVAAGGDVQGDRNVGKYIDQHGGEAALAKVKPYLEQADLAFINLEGPISDKGSPVVGKEYTFRSRTALAAGLASAGIDVVSLANNHARDYGAAALLDTFKRLEAVGIKWAGAGADAAEARSPALLETPAGTVAVLAFTGIIPSGFPAGSDRPGVATTSDQSRVVAAVKAAAERADYVIVSFHWGVEYEGVANSGQRALAHQVIDAGADLVLGHHPHVIQGLEIYKDRLIAYSLGDFVFDHYKRVTGEAFVLQVTLDREGPPTGKIIPVYLSDPWGIPAPVKGREADVILDRLARYSSALGLDLKRSGDHAFFD
jgi:poly-gamma-glutamate capsule biosynthesis protein CapA/YwtB (metallophosphatase superfamily)